MKTLIKVVLTTLTASSIASVALAAPGDGTYGRVVLEQAHVNSLAAQIEQLGGTPKLEDHVAYTPSAKASALSNEESSLRLQLNDLKAQRTE